MSSGQKIPRRSLLSALGILPFLNSFWNGLFATSTKGISECRVDDQPRDTNVRLFNTILNAVREFDSRWARSSPLIHNNRARLIYDRIMKECVVEHRSVTDIYSNGPCMIAEYKNIRHIPVETQSIICQSTADILAMLERIECP